MDNLLWQHLKTLPAFRALLRAVEARFYHQFDIPGPVLDLGCGDGDFAGHTFNEFGRKLDVGIDPWLNPLTKSVHHNIYGDGALQAMGDELPFPSNHFGSVISNSVLEHIPEITDVLVEAGRVLKPDGIFLMTMPNHRFTEMMWGAQFFEKLGLNGLANRYRRLFNFVSRHQHTEPVEWWAERLAQGGMVVERWQYYFSPAALHTLEFGHVQGLPAAISHLFTGKWIIAPTRENLALTERWVRPYYLEQADLDGCYQFIVARKVSDGPIVTPPLPPAQPYEVLPNGDLLGSDLPLTSIPADSIIPVIPAPSAVEQTEDWAEPAATYESETYQESPKTFLASVLPSVTALFAILVGTLLSMFAVFLTDGRGVDRPGSAIIIWLLAIFGAVFGLTRSVPNLESFPQAIAKRLTFKRVWLPVVLFAIAWLIRAWNLTGHPWIVSGTEAQFGLEKAFMSAGIQTNPFGIDGFTNPLLPLYFTRFTENFFGPSAFALRMLSPIIGAATVALTFVVGRRLWGQLAGLAAAILLLGNHTHIHFSRLGLTNIWDPFFMLASAALIVLAWQKKSRISWLAAGLISGAAFYFLTAGHLLVAIIPLLIATLAITDEIKAVWNPDEPILDGFPTIRSLLAGVGVGFVVALPLIANYVRRPGSFADRFIRQGVIQTNWIEAQVANTGASAGRVWLTQFSNALSFFSFTAEPDFSTYYGNDIGLITLLPKILFLVGLIVILQKLRNHANQMLVWMLLITVAAAGVLMTYPSQSHRYLVLIPVLCLMGGIGAQMVAILTRRWLKIENDFMVILWVILLAAGSIITDMRSYFGSWQDSHTFTDRNTEIAFEIANHLNTLPDGAVVYLQTEPELNSTFPTIAYLAPRFFRGTNIVDLPIMSGTPPQANPSGPTVFIILPDRQDEIDLLDQTFPNGVETEISGYFADPLFTVFTVN